jgi:hypothetical protein
MAYIGAPPQNRVLSSDDIAQGAVTLNDINFTDQPTNMDITGVIDKHTMRLADGVTITGDVTISDDLVLSKISDDGNAITMTNDGSSRTITGSGSIEASTLTQTPNASLTGMTGTIGSAVTNNAGVASGTIGSVVTGSPNLNLGNAIFPAGHIIQFVTATGNAASIAGQQSGYITTNVTGSITPKLAGSKIYVHAVFNIGILVTTNAGDSLFTNIYRSGSSVTDEYIETDGYDVYFEAAPRTSNAQWAARNPIAWYDTPSHSNTTDAITYTVYVQGGMASGCHVQIHKGHGKWTFQMMEIMQ